MSNELVKVEASPEFGKIPASNALAEASPESLADLMSIDPENAKFKLALPRIVAFLRDQRARFAASETEKASKPKGKAESSKPKAIELLKQSPKDPEELGF